MYKSFKSVIIFIFLFAILEKTGVQLVSFIKWQLEYIEPAELLERAETSSRENEKKEGKSLQETWLVNDFLERLKVDRPIFSNHKHYLNILIIESFYPAVPTPPPNLIIVKNI